MADAILEATQRAIRSMTKGADGKTGSVPMVTEKNAKPATADNGGAVSVSTKGTGYLGVDDEPAGSALNPIAQLGLFAKIRQDAGWLRYTTFAPVTENTGYLDLWDDRNFRMAPSASEGPRRNIPLHKPDVDQKTYACKTLSGAFGLRLKAIRSAARAGQDVNRLVQGGIAAGIANVFADIGVNGNINLPADTDLNKQRSLTNGWFQRMRNDSHNYTSSEDGFSYHNQIWAGMLQQLDKGYRSDKGLAWGMSDTLGTRWLTELTATRNPRDTYSHPSQNNPLGQALLNAMGAQANPLGREGIVVPQIDDQHYGAAEGYAGLAPTSVTDNGNGTLTFALTTLTGSTVRDSTGPDGQRYVTVGCKATGKSETIAVAYTSSTNKATTASLLGQITASTTASDYFIRWADLQPVFLGVWRFLTLVVQNGMRIYTVFYPHDETIEVIVHADIDYLVADYDATSLVDDLITPRFGIVS